MKSIRILVLCVSIITVGSPLHGQTAKVNPEIIDDLLRRPLIVEQLEIDQEVVASFDKKIANAKKQTLVDKYSRQKDEYVKFAEEFNQFIELAASKILTSHEAIVTKTGQEVQQLRKQKSTEYTVLYYEPYTVTGSDLHIKSLKYTRIERIGKKVDYSFFMPSISHREESERIKYGDCEITLKLMIEHLASVKALNKKNYSFSSYAKDQSELNCNQKSKYSLGLDKGMVQKNQTEEAMSAAIGIPVHQVSTTDLMKMIEDDRDELIALSIPLDIVIGGSSSNSALKISSSNINFTKCIVNAKTGKIIASSGRKASAYFSAKGLKKLGNCP